MTSGVILLTRGEAEIELSITLVHGTWPRGPFPNLSQLRQRSRCWFERDSLFGKSLETSLRMSGLFDKTEISAFLWSGNNSIFERDKAAFGLSTALMREKSKFRNCRRLVIAHSHGGNVALRALHYLPCDMPCVHIATIATPFVEVRLPLHHPGPLKLRKRIWGRILSPYSATLYLKWTKRARKLRSASSLAHLRRRNQHKLLILRAIDDEAALVLATGAIAARLSAAAGGWLLLPSILAAFFFCLGMLLFPLTFLRWAQQLAHGDSSLELNWGFFVFVLMTGSWLASGIFLFAINLFKAVYGRELLSDANTEINSQSVPDLSDTRTEILTLPQRFRRRMRRHMLYDAPQCTSLIVNWILRDW